MISPKPCIPSSCYRFVLQSEGADAGPLVPDYVQRGLIDQWFALSGSTDYLQWVCQRNIWTDIFRTW